MKLMQLKLENFKGVKEFILEADGHDVEVRGDNATGKTTLYDAFLYLLFGKDSAGNAQFEIKTLDAAGQPVHGLDHAVEATLLLNNGETLDLKKVYAESWTKRRGSAAKEFTGHTTSYWIDGVPTKAAEYKARIADIADEDLFRLLTNPLFFSEGMHWKERREMLLSVCGDVAAQDVIASNKDLDPMAAILAKRGIDDHQKVVHAERKRINEELEKLPVRIDERTQSLPDMTMGEASALLESLPFKISSAKQDADAKRAELSRVENGGQVAELTTDLRTVEGDIQRLKNHHAQAQHEAEREHRASIQPLEDEVARLERESKAEASAAEDARKKAESLKAKATALREAWAKEDAREFAPPHQPTECPACGQDIPQERIEDVRAKALEEFNAAKAAKLDDISRQGRELMAEAEQVEAKAKLHEDMAAELQAKVEAKRKDLDAKKAAPAPTIPEPAEIATLEAKRKDLEATIASLKAGNVEQVADIRGEIETLDAQIADLNRQLSEAERRIEGQKRIEELTAEERRLAGEYERLEGELHMIEQFVRAKVNILEEQINKRFRIARFKMFEEQINGGLTETCQVMVGGVPYGSLNRAARLQAGLDIINTLAEHYSFNPPIFVDNAEAVTRLPEMSAQLITMYVDADAQDLTYQVSEALAA